MKKAFTLLLVVFLITVLCSCDVQKVLEMLSEKTDSIVILDFDASDSRGMTMMPEDVPFLHVSGGMEPLYPNDDVTYGFWTSCFVLRSLPIFPGITSVNASAEGFCNSLKNKEFKGFGFPMKIVKTDKTEDGVYLVYHIFEDDRVFGQIEYYYSIKNKTFSYREIVTPLLGVMGADNIFIFELMNVPVEKSGNGLSFKAGDIYENGSYRNTEVVFESNGQGEINWDNTINKSFAIICDNKPFYLEVQTRKRIDDETDYFKRLHECIISKASKELETAGLLDLFDLEKADLSDESIEDFGDKDYIIYKINKELNVQYVSWKQIILKAMSAYIASSGTLSDINCFSVFGTTCFEVLWERLCSEVLDNKLSTPLKNLLPQTELIEDHKNAKLIDIIEKPKWTFTGKNASKTLIPDIISIEEIDGKQVFAIIDAKYYDPVLEEGKTPSNQPGIESVTKQYLYQLAYTDFINKYYSSKDIILNCFIFPSEKEYVEKKGKVVMRMFNVLNVEPKLNGIHILFVPASKFYQLYLESKKISINDIFNNCCTQI